MINVKKFLKENSDARYADFNRQFITSKYPILGVRIPMLRKFAKDVEPEYIDLDDPNLSHEEILLYGFAAGCISNEDEQLEYLTNLLPYFDNWATCDSVVPSLKKTNGKKGYEYYCALLADDREFYVRAGIVAMMRFFMKSEKLPEILQMIRKITAQDHYVKMATAWFYAELCAYNFETGKAEISACKDKFIKSQAIAKALQSYRVPAAAKTELETLRNP